VEADEAVNPKLSALLQKIAVNGELIVGISNNNVQEMVKVRAHLCKFARRPHYIIIIDYITLHDHNHPVGNRSDSRAFNELA
jgi:hypothetical protein